MERWCCATETSGAVLPNASFCGVSSAVFGYGFAALFAAAAMRASLAQITRVQASCCAELSVAVAQELGCFLVCYCTLARLQSTRAVTAASRGPGP